MQGIQAQLWNGRRFASGWMLWRGGKIAQLGFSSPPPKGHVCADFGRTRILPGFVDTLCHGFSGVDCSTGSAKDLQRMTRALAAAGVTTALAGFYPLSISELRMAAKRWQNWKLHRGTARTRVLGWHVEGPFIAPSMRGALPRKHLLTPSTKAARQLVKACGGWLRQCTLAAELPGSLDAVEVLRAAGVCPSIGHTQADYRHCIAFAANGGCGITHLGNRMPPLQAREPGPIGFAMAGFADYVGVIPDLMHVAPETLKLWARTPELKNSLLAVSDNLSHAGLVASSFSAGGQTLSRRGGSAVDKQGHLAGTLDPLPELLLRAHREGCLSMADVVRLGCENPGRFFGDCGVLREGHRADFVVLEPDLSLGSVWVGGRQVV